MGLAKIIGIQRHHNLDLGGKHIREYSGERERERERINVTYIVYCILKLIIIFSTVQLSRVGGSTACQH